MGYNICGLYLRYCCGEVLPLHCLNAIRMVCWLPGLGFPHNAIWMVCWLSGLGFPHNAVWMVCWLSRLGFPHNTIWMVCWLSGLGFPHNIIRMVCWLLGKGISQLSVKHSTKFNYLNTRSFYNLIHIRISFQIEISLLCCNLFQLPVWF